MKIRRSLRRMAAALLATALFMSTLMFMGSASVAKADNGAATTTIGMPKIVSDSVAAKGAEVSYDSISVQFLMGDFLNGGELTPFTVFGGDGSGTPSDVVGDKATHNWLNRWQWKCNQDTHTVLKIVAKEDLTLDIKDKKGAPSAWALDTVYAYYKEDAAGNRTLISEHPVTNPIPAGARDMTTGLKAGETVYIVYYSTTVQKGVSEYAPDLTITTGASGTKEENTTVAGGETDSEVENTTAADSGESGKVETGGNTTTIGMPKIVTDSVVAKGAEVSYDLISVQFLMGDFLNGGELKPFTVFGGDGSGSSKDFVGDTGNKATDNWVNRWEWKCNQDTHTVLKIVAKEDLTLKIKDKGSESAWATKTVYAYYKEDASGNRTLISEHPVTNPIPAGARDMTTALKAGETLYIVYYSTTVQKGVSNYAPDLTITPGVSGETENNTVAGGETDSEEENTTVAGGETDSEEESTAAVGGETDSEEETTTAAEGETDSEEESTTAAGGDADSEGKTAMTMGMPHIVTDSVAAKGGEISYDFFNAQFLMGDFMNGGELVPFTVFGGDGTGTPGDIVGDKESRNAVWRWQWRGDQAANTVLKIVATENIKLTVNQMKEQTGQWATHTVLAYVAENEKGERLTLSEHRITETISSGAMNQEVHLAKGDVFYIVYYSTNESMGTFGYAPDLVADKSAYDASLRTDFGIFEQLNKAIEECTASLQSKLAELLGDGTVYTEENAEKLTGYVNDAVKSMAGMSSVESINEARDKALEKMSEVHTIAQDADILAIFKADSKKQMAESVNEKDYSKDNWAVIEGIIAQANKDIDEAKRSADVNRILTKAMYDLKQVEVKKSAPVGLIVGIVAAVAVAVAAVVAVVVIKAKKKKADETEAADETETVEETES